MTRIVVIGADAAGMTAAAQARRRDPSLEIVAFDRGEYASYAACGEPYHIAGLVPDLEDLIARTPEEFARQGIEVRLRHEVTAIDPQRRVVSGTDLSSGAGFEEPYDRLLVATGAEPVVPRLPGVDLEEVHTLRTLGDAARLRERAERGAGRVVVVGGGYIGLEVAEAFDLRGWDVTIVEALPSLLPRTLDEDLGRALAEKVAEKGVEVILGSPVEAIVGDDRAKGVRIEGREIGADLVILGIGSRPVVEPARSAGVAVGETGAIAVDDHQRTSIEGIWAAGDCAETTHRVTGRPVNYHLGTVANKTGRVAGVNLAGGDAAFPGTLGSAITRFHEIEIASTGLRTAQARDAGFDAVEATVHGSTAAGYMPDAAPMTIRVTAERGTRRLLGAQIVGGPRAGKRIDVFATAIWQAMPGDELEWVDLAYAPPFSPVWDLVAIAARKAAEAAAS